VSVSDNGATALISALTHAFNIVSNQGLQADDFESNFVAHILRTAARVNRIDKVHACRYARTLIAIVARRFSSGRRCQSD